MCLNFRARLQFINLKYNYKLKFTIWKLNWNFSLICNQKLNYIINCDLRTIIKFYTKLE